MVAGIAYIFTPLTASGSLGDPSGFDANLRYVAPVLIVGFLLLPLIPWFRHGWRPWILIGLFTVLLIQGTVTQSNWEFEHHLASIALAFLIVGVPALLVAGVPARSQPGRHSSAFGLVMAIVAVALGRVRRTTTSTTATSPRRGRRWAAASGRPRSGSRSRTGDGRRATSGSGCVGRASAFGQYFFYGTDLTNHVQYLGQRAATTAPSGRSTTARSGGRRSTRATTTTSSRRRSSAQIETTAPPENLWTEQGQERHGP